METSSRTHQRVEHSADRRVRELYRYYQPLEQPSSTPSWLPESEVVPATGTTGLPDTPPVTDGTASASGSVSSRPSMIGPETLVLGTCNRTLTSFAQLAALRLDMERALVCVLDRDMQYIIAEATKTVSLDYSGSVSKDEIWLGKTENRKAWSLCQVSILSRILLPCLKAKASDRLP